LTYCQQKITINYYYHDTTYSGKDFYYLLRNPLTKFTVNDHDDYYLSNLVSTEEKDGLHHTKLNYLIPSDTTVSVLADGFGHKIFTLPGDEINIYLTKIRNTNGRQILNAKYLSPFHFNAKYEGKNNYLYSLFDSLAYKTGFGSFFNRIQLSVFNYQLPVFFDSVTTVYKQNLNYLNKFNLQHHPSSNLIKLANSEIRASYIDNLLDPFTEPGKEFNLNDFPKAYLDTLNASDFDKPEYFFKTTEFSQAAIVYDFVYRDRKTFNSRDISSEDNIKRKYNTINTRYKSQEIKEWLMTALFKFILLYNHKHKIKSCDSLLSNFKSQFPHSKYQKFIDSCYDVYSSKSSSIKLKDMLASAIVDVKGINHKIADMLENQPVFVDCWASWCVPCLKQFPFSNELEKKYKGKIRFVYLSFDRDTTKWIEKVNTLKINENSFILTDEFKSNFAQYFKMGSIPRYIIFDKKGQIINDDAPRPNNKEALVKILDALIE
jgi:thiol-disulfide isomerase/thioredoxin